ncbi:MAG: hypothetical protein VKJ64_19405 [Leptolyngbyaceae bacterium]|nr:hypothetical protein [Leptolyngbyaceae bacterium]
MAIQQSQYEELLATYTDHQGMLALLKQVRPYLEMLPSMRRPQHSLLTIPLPIIKVREPAPAGLSNASALASGDAVQIPCDVAVLMCDPDWKIKTGVEIFVFIHRPHEDFSSLLGRWRQTQVWINKGYDWLMPTRYRHMFGEGAEESYPLFVIFPETPHRVQRGLEGAELPYVVEQISAPTVDPDHPDPKDRDQTLDHNSTFADIDLDTDSSTFIPDS